MSGDTENCRSALSPSQLLKQTGQAPPLSDAGVSVDVKSWLSSPYGSEEACAGAMPNPRPLGGGVVNDIRHLLCQVER